MKGKSSLGKQNKRKKKQEIGEIRTHHLVSTGTRYCDKTHYATNTSPRGAQMDTHTRTCSPPQTSRHNSHLAADVSRTGSLSGGWASHIYSMGVHADVLQSHSKCVHKQKPEEKECPAAQRPIRRILEHRAIRHAGRGLRNIRGLYTNIKVSLGLYP